MSLLTSKVKSLLSRIFRQARAGALQATQCKRCLRPGQCTCNGLARLQISKMAPLARKQVDDVLGGEDAWKNVAKTDGRSAARGRAGGLLRFHTPGEIAGAWLYPPRCRDSVGHSNVSPYSAISLQPQPRPAESLSFIAAATCPKCSYHQAYFMEIQTRSADEPATLFFKCVQCAHRWREG
mgnify:CR=1 FL=1